VHNITPHLHFSELCNEKDCDEHQAPESFLDLLALSLHFDLGEGHLEYFSQGNKTDIDTELQVLFLNDFQLSAGQVHLISEDLITTISPEFESNGKRILCESKCSTYLRGPPHNA